MFVIYMLIGFTVTLACIVVLTLLYFLIRQAAAPHLARRGLPVALPSSSFLARAAPMSLSRKAVDSQAWQG